MLIFSIIAGIAALAAVTATLDDIGITTDEPYYYSSCLQQIEWFRQAREDFGAGRWSAPFSKEVLDRHWHFELIYNVHPPFYKLCSSLTLVLFEQWLGTMGAYRLAPAIMFSLLVSLIFWTVGRRYGIAAGLWAAGAFALMPRIFGHAHFGATDTPITVLWFASAVSFHRALESRKWAPVFALVYGLALSTKFTAFVIPLPLVACVLLSRKFRQAAWPVGIALVASPLIMIGLNPEWWHDTMERVYSYLINSATRSEYLYITTFYLGKTYDFYLPWHHSLIYTLFTVPLLVLAGFLYGFWRTIRRPFNDQWTSHMLLHWSAMHLVMMLPGSPGHDGVRLFLPSFVFLAVISAKGFYYFTLEASARLAEHSPKLGCRFKAMGAWVLLCLMLIPSLVGLVRVHPYELCYYNSLAGGIPGANKLGMETTYWYDAINESAYRQINNTIPDAASVSTKNPGLFIFLQRLGRIKPSPVFREDKYNFVMQYSRQGIFMDPDWLLYRKGAPIAELKKDGVRLLAIFQIPRVYHQIKADLEGSTSAESYFERALLYQVLGNEDSLFHNLSQCLKLEPTNIKATFTMVNYLLKNIRPNEAISLLERIAGSQMNKQSWHFNMGRAYSQLGKYEQAIASFRQALQYKHLDYWTLTNIAQIYLKTGKIEEATEIHDTILRTYPEDKHTLHMLGRINQHLKNTEKAKYYYNRLLEKNPGHTATLVNMGMISRSEGELSKAREFYQRALAVDSTDVSANLNLATLLVESGNLQLAEKHYKAVLRKQPEDSQTHLALALLYLKDPSRHPEALEQFRILTSLMPERVEFIEKKYIRPLEERLGRAVDMP